MNRKNALPILRLSNIHKSFGGVNALIGVDFDLHPGEIHALVGENGAGKSTLMKIIAGVHQPDEGKISVNDQTVIFSDPLVAQKYGISVIYQEPTLYMDLDIAENIYMGHHPVHEKYPLIRWKEMHEMAKIPLKGLGKEIGTYQKVRGLSIAQMQMVEMAKALSLNAHILVMDEPTSALTQHEVDDLFRIMRQLREKGVAIIFISHRLEEVFEIADRVTILRDGKFVDSKPISGLTNDEVIKKMVGRKIQTLFPKKNVKIGSEVLRVENLTKIGLFKDISFSLHSGEILGLAGLVGARRTDVAQTIFGISSQDSGRIFVFGEEKRFESPSQAMEESLAYVPEDRQMHGLILSMPIKDNITLTNLKKFAGKVGLINLKEEGSFASSIAERLEIKASGLWQDSRQLSRGNQQKAVLAKWLGINPKILILDEPTRGIDVGTKEAVHRLMGELVEQGVAILMISSELPEIIGMSDRIIVMCEGKLTGKFMRGEATQENILKAAMRRNNGS